MAKAEWYDKGLQDFYEHRTHRVIGLSWPDTERETVRCSCGQDFLSREGESARCLHAKHAYKARFDVLRALLEAGQAMRNSPAEWHDLSWQQYDIVRRAFLEGSDGKG